VPKGLEQPRHGLGRRQAVGMRVGGPAGRVGEEADPQPAGIRPDFFGEWPDRRRRSVRISRHGAGHQVEDRR